MWRGVLFAAIFLATGPALAEQGVDAVTVPVLLGANEIGSVELESGAGDTVRIKTDGLSPWVEQNLSIEKQAVFKAMPTNDFMDVATLKNAGFELDYDQNYAVFHMKPVADNLKLRSISVQSPYLAGMSEALKPANLSGFLNVRGGQDYVEDSLTNEGRQPARLDLDGAANMHGWVLEGRADYLEDATNAWQRDDVRLVHDWPDKMVRGAVGDLSYPLTEFQNYQKMAGFSLARNFDLQPYRVTEPSGGTSFIIRTPSSVDIMINGQRVRTLQLDPGPYDISDFPLADGSNDVTLVITDATGHIETRSFPILTDQKLLKQGLHEYSYNIGIESQERNRDIKYQVRTPAFSAFHRYGFSDETTGEISAQADTEIQQAGLAAIHAFEWGTLGFDTAISHSDDFGDDAAAKLSYRYENTSDQEGFSAYAQYKGGNFSTLGQVTENTSPVWEIVAQYSRTIGPDINLGIGGRYSLGQDDGHIWAYNMNIGKVLSQSFTANINFQQRSETGASIILGITWIPALSEHTVSATLDTETQTKDIRWDWRDDNRWQVGAGATEQHGEVHGTGNVGFTGDRIEASLRHNITTFLPSSRSDTTNHTDTRSQILAGTAIAFADGHIALSKPISSSFVLLAPHKNLEGQTIGINPETERDGNNHYQSEIDSFGPAVVEDTVPYMARQIRIDTQNLPLGYDIGQDNYVAMPSYKSGMVLTVGNGANVFADGYLQMADSTPVIQKAGMIKNLDDPSFPEQEFFTNDHARFRISQLEPGKYSLQLHDSNSAVIMVIPDDAPIGQFNAGTLVMSMGRHD